MDSKGLRLRVVVGRDTRRSGTMLEAALSSGLCSMGVDVVSLGVVPTPAVSYIARTGDYGLGAIISASHNPAADNGIKFVGHDGFKTTEETEIAIESLVGQTPDDRPDGKAVGCVSTDTGEIEGYLDYLASLVPERLDGTSVAMDAAHGAAYRLAPEVLRRLGAEVVLVGAQPDGLNINAEGGATKPETIQELTVASGLDVGVAFDGDADRAVFSDGKGRLVNGDRTIGLWAVHWQRYGRLRPPVVVGTVMTNGGFEHYLAQQGIHVERTPVGDKHVSDRIHTLGVQIGGEQSGHIIFRELGPTGDGLIIMLEVLRVLKREGRPLSAFADAYEPWPQLLVNVAVACRDPWDSRPAIVAAVGEAEAALCGKGRIVVRASGTQPMIRVMVEAEAYPSRDSAAETVLAALARELSGTIYSKVDLTHALGD